MLRLVWGPDGDRDADPARSRADRRSWQLIPASSTDASELSLLIRMHMVPSPCTGSPFIRSHTQALEIHAFDPCIRASHPYVPDTHQIRKLQIH
ncbi:hypothetical protein NDU88_001625 [Pleurodeles waltl]|uniref:Uncharacterized protein n=1 Tax=Pleurodeles waltl TaxID=8319 RepID=A0AAV7Q4W1_PLEWA|nr:hypothetical protein NDU88_001625 [Pleurodeles waltl]